MKLQQFVSFPGLATQKIKHNKYEQNYPNLKYPYIFKNSSCLIGIEIEIENIQNSIADSLQYYWEETEDHSLRNFGREYKSIPLRASQIPYAFEYLKTLLDYTNPNHQFSNRCSVHIHLNVRDFTMEQLACFLLLYCIFEKHFFYIAGTKRENNIFCVPLWKTNKLPPKDSLLDPVYYKNWHKYLALNCGCIFGSEHNKCFGTVEFRHLYGTLDNTILYPWIDSIIALREASVKYKLNDLLLELETANTTSNYLKWYSNIFEDLRIPSQYLTKNNYEFCISNTKLNLYLRNNIQFTSYYINQETHWFKTKKIEDTEKTKTLKNQQNSPKNKFLHFLTNVEPITTPIWPPHESPTLPNNLNYEEALADFLNNQTTN